MAITRISSPETMSFTYNPMEYVYSSTNVANVGFRFVVDVYYAGTSTKIYEGRVVPDPSDNYCRFDLSSILKNLMSKNLSINDNFRVAIPNMYVKFDVKIGEEYLYDWDYDTISSSVDGAVLNQSPNVAANTFIVGDYINVVSSPANGNVDGLRTVRARTDYTLTISADGTTSATGGSTYYSNNSKTTVRDLDTLSNQYAYRGALSFKDFIGYDDATYSNSTSLLGNFLTNAPREGYTITENSRLWLNIYGTALNTSAARMYFENDNGDLYYFTTGATATGFTSIACGIDNLPTLTLASGSGDLIKDDTLWYEVYTATSGGTISSERFRINIDRICAINEIEILFMDKLGSWLSFPFPLRTEISGDIQKQKYESRLPSPYTSIDRGVNTFAISEVGRYKLQSNWLTDGMSELFTNLLSTPFAYMRLDDVYYSIDILDSSFTRQQQKNKNLIRYELNVQLANKESSNG